jgi:Holliday junction DNA helicase RuvA
VGYLVTVPLGVAERLPEAGTRITLHTELVVKEDGWSLFGFDDDGEKAVFQRLLTASGFGPKLALGMLSALGPARTVKSIQMKDIAALSTVSGIGRKKAERLILELEDKFKHVALTPDAAPSAPGADDTVRALVNLGYGPPAAEAAVRAALVEAGTTDAAILLKRALAHLAATKSGRPA